MYPAQSHKGRIWTQVIQWNSFNDLTVTQGTWVLVLHWQHSTRGPHREERSPSVLDGFPSGVCERSPSSRIVMRMWKEQNESLPKSSKHYINIPCAKYIQLWMFQQHIDYFVKYREDPTVWYLRHLGVSFTVSVCKLVSGRPKSWLQNRAPWTKQVKSRRDIYC